MKCFVGPQLSHCLGGADGTSGTVHGWLDLMPCRTSQLGPPLRPVPLGTFQEAKRGKVGEPKVALDESGWINRGRFPRLMGGSLFCLESLV